jgi:hypothetical protein
MAELRFSLMGEGSSDQSLLFIIRWLLGQHVSGVEIIGTWPEAGERTAGRDLGERIVECVKAEQSHLLFVHRDADNAGREARVIEIARAMTVARRWLPILPIVVPVVPVRMIETWLLTDEAAIREAARNPSGRMSLPLPRVRDLERIVDPKVVLRGLLLTASGLGTRRRRHVDVNLIRIAELTASFEGLRQLPAFQAFEADVRQVIQDQGWPERLA